MRYETLRTGLQVRPGRPSLAAAQVTPLLTHADGKNVHLIKAALAAIASTISRPRLTQ